MTSASAGSPKGQDPERGLIAEGDNIAVGRQADAPEIATDPERPIILAHELVPERYAVEEAPDLRLAYARISQEALEPERAIRADCELTNRPAIGF
jgi:hypothetical protein